MGSSLFLGEPSFLECPLSRAVGVALWEVHLEVVPSKLFDGHAEDGGELACSHGQHDFVGRGEYGDALAAADNVVQDRAEVQAEEKAAKGVSLLDALTAHDGVRTKQ